MAIVTVTARDFARDLAGAKQAAEAGPVIVTDRGQPRYALLKIEDYYRLSGAPPTSLLAVMDGLPAAGPEFEPAVLAPEPARAADLG